jgi:UTP:GlnB (protein PII) uridylyltransferase
VVVARKTCQRLDLGAAAEQEVAALVTDANLLVGAARRIDGLGEEAVLQLAAHLETPGRAAALYVLTQARHELAAIDRSRLGTLYELVQDALAHPELVGREAVNTLERRRREIAVDVAGSVDGLERVEHAPRAYLLRVPPSDVARHVRLCDPIPPAGSLRVGVSPVLARAGWWNVDVVARDQPGLLARHTGVLARFGARIEDAVAATWGDRCALASFRLWLPGAPDSEELRAALEHELSAPLVADPHPDIVLGFDDEASPWHTLATAAAPDHNGLLHAIATVLAAGGADIHAGRVHADAGRATCVFEVTNRRGSKLTATDEAAILALVEQGVAPASRRRGRAHVRAARPR